MKIVVNNSTSQLLDCDIATFRFVKQLLSYKIPEAQFHFSGSFGVPYRFLIDKQGVFNTGLLGLLTHYLDSIEAKYTVQDLRIRPTAGFKRFSLDLKGVKPYKQQIEAVEACKQYIKGTVSAVTGSGKSLIMVLLVNELKLNTLIVVPTVGLKHQLRATFEKHFGSLKNITIENIDSKELKKPGNYDLLIIDESHHSASATYQKLNKTMWNSIYWRFFFTATPYRAQVEEQLLFESMAGSVIYELTYQDAVKNNMIVPVTASIVKASDLKVTGSKWKEVYNKLIVNNFERNAFIGGMLKKFSQSGVPTLCLVKEIAHGVQLSNNGAFPFVYGEDKTSKDYIELFNKGVIKTLIGTVGVLGEGIDSRPAEVVIIAGMGKSKPQLLQMVGRVLRKSPGKTEGHVILIDDSKLHRWGARHTKTQVEIIEEVYGIKVERIEV